MVPLILASVLLFGGALQPTLHQDPVEREWSVRRQALGHDPGELTAGLRAEDWRERVRALDACVRALRAGGEVDPAWNAGVRAALADEHGNVRGEALRVLAAQGEGASLEEARARVLAGDALPSVRLELARALGRVACAGTADVLRQLCGDPDDRVASAALRSLCARSHGGQEALTLVGLWQELDDSQALRAVGWLLRSEPDGRLLQELRRRYDGEDAHSRSWGALLEALALARGEEADVRRLVAGWSGTGGWEPRRQRVFLAAAESGNEALTVACLEELERLLVPANSASEEELESLEQVRHELLEAALSSSGARRVLELALELPLVGATRIALLPPAGRALGSWDGIGTESFATAEDARVRRAFVEALAATFSRSGDAAAGRLLVQALDDPEPSVSILAFHSLCAGEPFDPWAEPVHGAWLRLSAEERTERLGWIPRDVPLPAFRSELLARGEAGGAGRRTACELLAGLHGDVGVRDRITGWLASDLDRLQAEFGREGAVPRDLELGLQGELRALGKLDAAGSAEAVARALELSVGRSAEVGKLAALVLGRSEPGRVKLRAALEPRVERRTRIEAAIWLAPSNDASAPAAVERLIEDFSGAAWDLRGRILAALAKVPVESAASQAARAFLAALILEESASIDDRLNAMATLDAGSPLAVELLVAVAEATRNADLALAALGRLGRVGGAEARDELQRLFEENQRAPVGTEEERARRALRTGALLEALAVCGEVPEAVAGRWLSEPLRSAPVDLEARFRGADLPAVDFAWRGELALARALARESRAADALARHPGFERLDGRLLLALGESVGAAGESPAALALLGAASVGMEGEREVPREELGRARCKLLGVLWAEERWGASARLAAELLALRRAEEMPRQVWDAAFGVFDRERGIDPESRVRSAVWQARAWAALGQGEDETALSLAAQAEKRLGVSALAHAEQARLLAACQESSAGR